MGKFDSCTENTKEKKVGNDMHINLGFGLTLGVKDRKQAITCLLD